jgi:multiple sugar transport system permease protein
MTMTADKPLTAGTAMPSAPRRRRNGRLENNTGGRTLISAADLGRPRGRATYFTILTIFIIVFTLTFLFPLYWMFTGGLKSSPELLQSPPTVYPHHFHFSNYLTAWNEFHIGHYFLNTVYYAVGGWLLQLIIDVSAAYALSKLRPLFGNYILGAMLASLMLPATALIVPTYITVVHLPIFGWNLLNTPWALWLPAAASAFNIWVLKRFFDQIPTELLDSASIDGAGRLRILWNIVLPLSRPVLAVISIFAIIASWKDFLWPMLVLQDPDKQTLSVAIARLNINGRVPADIVIAALVIAAVPMLAIFAVFQKHILNGLGAGALKG